MCKMRHCAVETRKILKVWHKNVSHKNRQPFTQPSLSSSHHSVITFKDNKSTRAKLEPQVGQRCDSLELFLVALSTSCLAETNLLKLWIRNIVTRHRNLLRGTWSTGKHGKQDGGKKERRWRGGKGNGGEEMKWKEKHGWLEEQKWWEKIKEASNKVER